MIFSYGIKPFVEESIVCLINVELYELFIYSYHLFEESERVFNILK